MKRQKLVITRSPKDIDIPGLLFYQNTIIIVYTEFRKELVKYIYIENIFLVPEDIFNLHKDSQYKITKSKIEFGLSVLRNDCTIDGKSFIPGIEKQEEDFKNKFYKELPLVVDEPLKELKRIHELSKIKIPVNTYNNIDIRIKRLQDFGDVKYGKILRNMFEKNKDKFDSVSSIHLPTNDLSSVRGISLNNLDIKYKMSDSISILEFDGYMTYIDTMTNLYYKFESNIRDDILMNKLLVKHETVTVFYSILNYSINQNINAKTNLDAFYSKTREIMLKDYYVY